MTDSYYTYKRIKYELILKELKKEITQKEVDKSAESRILCSR